MQMLQLLAAVALLSWAAPATAQSDASVKRERLLVLDFDVGDGIDSGISAVANDTFITTLNQLQRFEVATSADLRTMLNTDSERQILDCNDESCMVEVAGALGARYLSRGRLSLLDEDVVLTLQLFDTDKASLDNQLTSTLPEGGDALAPAVERMTYSLLRIERVEPPSWYENPWVWVGVGVVLAGATTAFVLTGGGDDDVPNLGRFTIDG